MISKRSKPLVIAALYLFCSFFISSCSKDNKESGSDADSLKNKTSASTIKKDTTLLVKDDSLVNKKEKSDTIKGKEIREPNVSSVNNTVKKEDKRIIAYYFHPTARCPTCINIENYAKEVINEKFSKEKEKGLISFREVNIEDSLNEHFVTDYNLTSSSLILVIYNNNKQVKWKNLEQVWKYAHDKESFFIYVKTEIKIFLKQMEGT